MNLRDRLDRLHPPEPAPPTPDPPQAVTDTIRRMPMFQDLTEAEVRKVAQIPDLVDLPADTVLYRAGDVPSAIYALVAGSITVSRDADPDSPPTVLVDPGAAPGLFEFVRNRPLSATAVVAAHSRLLVFRIDAFDAFMTSNHRIAMKVMCTFTF